MPSLPRNGIIPATGEWREDTYVRSGNRRQNNLKRHTISHSMKPGHFLGLLVVAAVLIACAGCTGTSPAPAVPAATATPTPATGPAAPVQTPYPGALSLKQETAFGIGGKNGTATVYSVRTQPNYTWTSPSFNSVREQAEAGDAHGTQRGYNTKQPAAGNRFLFTYVRLTNTGSGSMVVPSPGQFTVSYNGKTYPYSSTGGSDVTIGGIQGTQYDYTIGSGGTAGYIQPGAGNAADGYLIYEVPDSIDLAKAYLVIALDPQHQPAWQLG